MQSVCEKAVVRATTAGKQAEDLPGSPFPDPLPADATIDDVPLAVEWKPLNTAMTTAAGTTTLPSSNHSDQSASCCARCCHDSSDNGSNGSNSTGQHGNHHANHNDVIPHHGSPRKLLENRKLIKGSYCHCNELQHNSGSEGAATVIFCPREIPSESATLKTRKHSRNNSCNMDNNSMSPFRNSLKSVNQNSSSPHNSCTAHQRRKASAATSNTSKLQGSWPRIVKSPSLEQLNSHRKSTSSFNQFNLIPSSCAECSIDHQPDHDHHRVNNSHHVRKASISSSQMQQHQHNSHHRPHRHSQNHHQHHHVLAGNHQHNVSKHAHHHQQQHHQHHRQHHCHRPQPASNTTTTRPDSLSSNQLTDLFKETTCPQCLPHESPNRQRSRRHRIRNRKHHPSELSDEIWIDGPMLEASSSSPSKLTKKQEAFTKITDPVFDSRNHRIQEWMHHHNYHSQHNSSSYLNSGYHVQDEDAKSEAARSDSCVAEFPRSLRLEEFLKQLIAVTSQSDQSSESPLTNNLSLQDKTLEEVRSEDHQGIDTGIGTTSGSPSDQEENLTRSHRVKQTSSAPRLRSASCSSSHAQNDPDHLILTGSGSCNSKQIVLIPDHHYDDAKKRKPRSKLLQAFCCSRQ